MKKFKIQSFLQKNFFKKNILNKMFSSFFSLFNMSKSSWKVSFNQLNKKKRLNTILLCLLAKNLVKKKQRKKKYEKKI